MNFDFLEKPMAGDYCEDDDYYCKHLSNGRCLYFKKDLEEGEYDYKRCDECLYFDRKSYILKNKKSRKVLSLDDKIDRFLQSVKSFSNDEILEALKKKLS